METGKNERTNERECIRNAKGKIWPTNIKKQQQQQQKKPNNDKNELNTHTYI